MMVQMKGLRQAAIALALCSGAAGARAATPAVPPAVAQALRCTPGAACAAKIPVKVVIVTMFEVGQDTGDVPGEFQFWRERRKLDVRIPFPQSHHDLYYNPQEPDPGHGHRHGLDPLGHGHAGAGAGPAVRLVPRLLAGGRHRRGRSAPGHDRFGSLGALSGRWRPGARNRRARDPADWKSGYFALHSNGPGDKRPQQADEGEMFALNPALADWAYGLTKTIALPDSPQLAAARAPYTGMAPAQSPPKVMTGDNLAAMTFWHGAKMTEWAHDWVDFWTGGKGVFVTSAMEETGTFQSLEYLSRIGRADRNRVMVLRGASNFTMPPPAWPRRITCSRKTRTIRACAPRSKRSIRWIKGGGHPAGRLAALCAQGAGLNEQRRARPCRCDRADG
jgi:purine nucleoside permease